LFAAYLSRLDNDMIGSTHERELSQMFADQFGGNYDAPASTLASGVAAAFQVGADPETLPAAD